MAKGQMRSNKEKKKPKADKNKQKGRVTVTIRSGAAKQARPEPLWQEGLGIGRPGKPRGAMVPAADKFTLDGLAQSRSRGPYRPRDGSRSTHGESRMRVGRSQGVGNATAR